LVFNYDFPDKRYHSRNKRGEPLYTSAELADLWFQGFNTIGEVTAESAVYCAKYALKKVTGDPAYAHYEFVDGDGVISAREPEFAIMSRRPGIGASYYEKYGSEVRDLDSVVIDGREVKTPRFYDERSKRVDEYLMLRHKRDRKHSAVLNKADNTPERLRVKEEIMVRAAAKKERSL